MKNLLNSKFVALVIAGGLVVSGVAFGLQAVNAESNSGPGNSASLEKAKNEKPEAMKKVERQADNLQRKLEKFSNLEPDEDDLGDVLSNKDNRQAVLVGRNGKTLLFNAEITEISPIGSTGTTSTTSTNNPVQLRVKIWFHHLDVKTDEKTVVAPHGSTFKVGDRINVRGMMIETATFKGVMADKILNHTAPKEDSAKIEARINELRELLAKLQKQLDEIRSR